MHTAPRTTQTRRPAALAAFLLLVLLTPGCGKALPTSPVTSSPSASSAVAPTALGMHTDVDVDGAPTPSGAPEIGGPSAPAEPIVSTPGPSSRGHGRKRGHTKH